MRRTRSVQVRTCFISRRCGKVDGVRRRMSATTTSPVLYCDSGMIPWLLVRRSSASAPEPVAARGRADASVPASGEINRRLTADPKPYWPACAAYESKGCGIDFTDGLSLEFRRALQPAQLQYGARSSRLTSSHAGMRRDERKTAEILALLDS